MRYLREAKIESGQGMRRTFLIIVGLWSYACAWADDAPVVETVLAYQRDSGGWPKNYDRKRILTMSEQRQLQKQRAQADTTSITGQPIPKFACSLQPSMPQESPSLNLQR